MADTGAGSFSGGECCHLSRGFMISHVLPLCRIRLLSNGISMASVVALGAVCPVGLRMLGETPRGVRILVLRRVLASQFEIWFDLSPVWILSSSFSSSVGYGWSRCRSIQSLRILIAVLGNLVPVFRVGRSSSSSRVLVADLSNDFNATTPVRAPCSMQASSCTVCRVSITELFLAMTKEHGRNKALQAEQALWFSKVKKHSSCSARQYSHDCSGFLYLGIHCSKFA